MITASHLTVPIIGIVRSPLTQKFGVPRQPNLVEIPCQLEFIAPYNNPQAFKGLDAFSHIWVIWQFHHNRLQGESAAVFRPQVRPPRLGGNDKLGVFATRSMYRPAALGLSVVRLVSVETQDDKTILQILGADMVDGTPIIDIKPYLAYSDNVAQAHSGFANQPPTAKLVYWSNEAEKQSSLLIKENSLSTNDMTVIEQLIAQDPRPAYRQDELDTEFTMRYKAVDITFTLNASQAIEIIRLKNLTDKS